MQVCLTFAGSIVLKRLFLLSVQYFRILLLANVMSLPIVLYLIHSWQSNYAYFAPLSAMLFVFTFLINALIAAVIVYVQSVKAASLNPVESLKYE